ncbi:uncharacterized protein LOC127799663 [Diospyros lotus]|uniref:uncharacterized protein LOC127799663 n=1 Tax=Diospyros lotus TaxID=55363 RepID=UPI002251A70B|nr:uncharacterized protein LOC127799663 [Diospyros lotus]
MANTRGHRRTLSQGVETRLPPRNSQQQGAPPTIHNSQQHPPPPHNAQTQGGDCSISPNRQMGDQSIPPSFNMGSGSLPTNQAGTSRQPPRTVPWEEYEALRQQHVEGMQALRDMVGVLQSMIPGGTLSDTLKKFMPPLEPQPEAGADSYQEATPDSHSRSTPPREGRPRSPPPRRIPHSVPRKNENPRMENRTRSPQKRRYHETVASTPTRHDN